jgi:hypothetical protein
MEGQEIGAAQRLKANAEEADQAIVLTQSTTPVRVTQAPAGATRTLKDGRSDRQQFPVSFAQLGDTLHVTLFASPPLDEAALRNSVVEEVSHDSLIIQAGSRVFGVRIPGNILQQQMQQSRPK